MVNIAWAESISLSPVDPDAFQIRMGSRLWYDFQLREWCEWFKEYHAGLRDVSGVVQLQCVDFSNNGLTSAGIQLLLEVLQETRCVVRILRLFRNHVGPVGGQMICRYLEDHPGEMQQLHISNMDLGVDAVTDIVCCISALGVRDFYPMDGVTPFWLQAKWNEYDSVLLETKIRLALDAFDPPLPLNEVLCVPDRNKARCSPSKCYALDPAPILQAPYLFAHYCTPVPTTLHKTTEEAKVNWPPLLEDSQGRYKASVVGKSMSNETVGKWCRAVQRQLRECPEQQKSVILKEVDFSNCRLTRRGLQELIKFFVKRRIRIGVLKIDGNIYEFGEDVDFMMMRSRTTARPPTRCPILTQGCICGRNCEVNVPRAQLEKKWARRVDTRKVIGIAMQNQGVDDINVEIWCSWFEEHLTRRLHGERDFDTIDFSCNHLTHLGCGLLLRRLQTLKVRCRVLKLFRNKILLDSGCRIAKFIKWNQGMLQALLISHNKLGVGAVHDIIEEIVQMRRADGSNCYPVLDVPFWLRAEVNLSPADAIDLEHRVRLTLHRLGRPFDQSLCITSHSKMCKPEKCCRSEPAPALHVMYLFPHMERHAQDAAADDVNAYGGAAEEKSEIEEHGSEFELEIVDSGSDSGKQHGRQEGKSGRTRRSRHLILRMGIEQLRSVQKELQHEVLQVCEEPMSQPRPEPQRDPPPSCMGFYRPDEALKTTLAAQICKHHCFLSDTNFRLADDSGYKTAAELPVAGGVRLMGPNGSSVVVRHVVHHPEATRHFVRIRVEGCSGVFVVTDDHRLMVSATRGGEVRAVRASVIVRRCRSMPQQISDGVNLLKVTEAEEFTDRRCVVEVYFENDDPAVVFILPRRWRRSTLGMPRLGVFGEDVRYSESTRNQLYEGQEVTRTFLHNLPSLEGVHAGRQGHPRRRTSSAPPRLG
eukprot:TRINITY_DN43711_c0_g1_i1.p1 TRINITY_DN43711_c0_g1~~TRINITY_DN43711_c0_g1_i1.p1  ORF type:complete len:927 (+),score=72.42 TRINITY_DN43711_c0_g1_i1:75-2855(+)